MANIEWSQFTSGSDMQVGDQAVGLRSGVNLRFTFPSDGLKDASGNFLIGWSSVSSAVNYVKVINSATGNPSLITSAGSDTNIGLTLITQGMGNITFTPGGAGTINCSTHLILSTSMPLTDLEAASKGYVDSKVISTPVSLADGGTSASLIASNGGIFYSTSTAGAILSGTATASQVLLSGSSSAPSWSTATYPGTTTASQLLYSSSNNVISGLSTANNGTLVTSSAGVPSILVGPGTSGNVFSSNASAAPSWSTATYANTYAADNLLYASSANTVSGLATAMNGVLVTDGSGVPSIGSALPSAVQLNITQLGTITSGTWNAGIISPQYGGTGVNNSTSTITIGGSFTMSGAFLFTGTLTGNTSVTFPTSGTLATTADLPSLPLSLANGGTGASLTASNGGIFYSGASAGAILNGVSTANQVLVSGSNTTPAWTTTPYLTSVKDVNANINVAFSSFASAVNYPVLISATTGQPVVLSALGSNTDISINLQPKGAGQVNLLTSALTNPLTIYSGTSFQHVTNFVFSNTSATRNVTFPDASGTVAFTTDIPTLPLTVPNGGTGNTTFTAYSVICAGTTSTGTFQNVSGVGTSGQVLTSNGASMLPTWQNTGASATPTKQIFTSGSGTYTTPANCRYIDIEICGGGSGGQGDSSSGTVVTAATAGGNTTFSTLTANGGAINASINYPSGTGGTSSGGDLNVTGGDGGGGTQNITASIAGVGVNQNPGGTGASSYFGGGGGSTLSGGGNPGKAYGSGGGGAGITTNVAYVSGAGGGAGGYCRKRITSPSSTYSYAVGAAGSAGVGAQFNGGAGVAGVIVVNEYY